MHTYIDSKTCMQVLSTTNLLFYFTVTHLWWLLKYSTFDPLNHYSKHKSLPQWIPFKRYLRNEKLSVYSCTVYLTSVSGLSRCIRRCRSDPFLASQLRFPCRFMLSILLHSLSLLQSLLSSSAQACTQLWHRQTLRAREGGRLMMGFFSVVRGKGRLGPAFFLWCHVKFGTKYRVLPQQKN